MKPSLRPRSKCTANTCVRWATYTTNNAKEDYQFRKTLTAWDECSNQAHWRKRAEGQPFFSIFNIGVTHESRIWVKAEDSLWVDEDLEVPVPPYLPDNEIGQQDVRRMYSNIKEMDHRVGEILAELEEDGLLEKTIIFWYTDHGGPLPRMKRLVYDSGIRVPMVIRFPEAVTGRGHRQPFDQFHRFVTNLALPWLVQSRPLTYRDKPFWAHTMLRIVNTCMPPGTVSMRPMTG